MFEADPVMLSRILTGLTLAFHVIFATLGVGVPIMIALAEWMGIRRNDPHYTMLARRWARGFVITVAVGVVTGTAIGLQLSLLWPNFMQVAGQVIALPMFMEVFAFFFEAIFLGIYLYTWDRFKSKVRHFLLIIPVILGATASAFFITTVNAFMNTPQGFELVDGVMRNIQPLEAMFNPATPTKTAHVIITCYLTSAFILAMIAAWKLFRGNDHAYHKKGLHLSMVAAFIFSIGTVLIGDLSGKFLAEYQPEKLAAAEWHFETETEAPLVLGGVLNDEGEVEYALEIPYALSILAYGTPGAEVEGLNETPEDLWPPLWVHYAFDLMVFIGMYLTFISGAYLAIYKFKRHLLYNRPLLFGIIAGGPLAFVAIQSGWFYAEVGRQPWILNGLMKTAEGATQADHVGLMLILFILLYLFLGISTVLVLRGMFKKKPAEQELYERGIETRGDSA
ncbi:cytochrome bd-I ubiquinol oxidase subunit 1 apoprotein [Salsuginibacillus halophilus]|uniref:Cytochrome bd-I ubiquinol oxidase subunit 1 apoprotein n=1 Tax=Salsuginibacillus halophilus TaxID=517424 RepID=A0A2P8HBJ8_9BACI|nr:cytochrome ubiquinol oxidase subunit I [Salsuginibacillus halophilus]PSL43599.1 cytochrome bd-I ubiquinol oxidase subunit 1 apoprotein [Salsuginibacillus halophilus]